MHLNQQRMNEMLREPKAKHLLKQLLHNRQPVSLIQESQSQFIPPLPGPFSSGLPRYRENDTKPNDRLQNLSKKESPATVTVQGYATGVERFMLALRSYAGLTGGQNLKSDRDPRSLYSQR